MLGVGPRSRTSCISTSSSRTNAPTASKPLAMDTHRENALARESVELNWRDLPEAYPRVDQSAHATVWPFAGKTVLRNPSHVQAGYPELGVSSFLRSGSLSRNPETRKISAPCLRPRSNFGVHSESEMSRNSAALTQSGHGAERLAGLLAQPCPRLASGVFLHERYRDEFDQLSKPCPVAASSSSRSALSGKSMRPRWCRSPATWRR